MKFMNFFCFNFNENKLKMNKSIVGKYELKTN